MVVHYHMHGRAAGTMMISGDKIVNTHVCFATRSKKTQKETIMTKKHTQQGMIQKKLMSTVDSTPSSYMFPAALPCM